MFNNNRRSGDNNREKVCVSVCVSVCVCSNHQLTVLTRSLEFHHPLVILEAGIIQKTGLISGLHEIIGLGSQMNWALKEGENAFNSLMCSLTRDGVGR